MKFVLGVPAPTYVDTPEKVEEAIQRCRASSALAVDTETLGKPPKVPCFKDQVLYMGLSPDEEARYFVPRSHIRHFRDLLGDPNIVKCFHNFKFDAYRLWRAGIDIRGPLMDSWIMDWLLDEDTRENRHKLDDCSKDYFDIPMAKYKSIMRKNDPREVKPGHEIWEQFLDYGSLDAWVTRKLCLYLADLLSKVDVWGDGSLSLLDHYWDIEEDQIKTLFEMEKRGIRVNAEYLENVSGLLEHQMNEHAANICRLVGHVVNPNSPKQVAALLFTEMGLTPIAKTNTGAPSCDERSLNHFATQGVAVCKELVAYRKAGKILGTYARGMLKWVDVAGNIHTSYSPVAVTGRLTSGSPNLQNIPRNDEYGIKAAFVADPGCKLIVVDYAQLEMRIMAHFSQDQAMIDCFNGGYDMHSYTAALMMGIPYGDFMEKKEVGDEHAKTIRQAAKAVGFGILYCNGAPKLSETLSESLGKDVSVGEAQKYMDDYLGSFPNIGVQIEAFKRHAKKHGYVQTLCGRFRRLSKIRSRNWSERGSAERQAVNSPIQGTAADIVKKSMIRCEQDAKLAELGCTLRLQVHDELVFNCPKDTAEEAAKIIQEYMENPFIVPIDVPLPAEPSIVDNWKEAK